MNLPASTRSTGTRLAGNLLALLVLAVLLPMALDWTWSLFGGAPFATCKMLPILYRLAQALPYALGVWGVVWLVASGFRGWSPLLLLVVAVVTYDAPDLVLMLLEPSCA
jgi:hypothetical protein